MKSHEFLQIKYDYCLKVKKQPKIDDVRNIIEALFKPN